MYPWVIHRFPIFELVSFVIVFGSQIFYGLKDLRRNFSILCLLGQISFQSNVQFSMIFGHSSFRPYVHSVICLSAICPFGHMSIGHTSVWPFVFRPSVLPPSPCAVENRVCYVHIFNWLINAKIICINVQKTNYMIISNRNQIEIMNITLNGQPIVRTSHHKFQGVFIDDKLEYDTHIN